MFSKKTQSLKVSITCYELVRGMKIQTLNFSLCLLVICLFLVWRHLKNFFDFIEDHFKNFTSLSFSKQESISRIMFIQIKY